MAAVMAGMDTGGWIGAGFNLIGTKISDKLACVGNLKHAMKAGDMMTEEEILKLQQNTQDPNMEGILKPSKRWRRMKSKENKK